MGPRGDGVGGRRGGPAEPGDAIPIGAHILVIEDDQAVRDLIRTILERAGHRATVAGDGAAALAAVSGAGRPPDVAIVDIVLPGPNGVAIVRLLRESWPDLPAIFVTGHPADLPDTGTDLLLEKPFPPAALLAGVTSALAGVGRPDGQPPRRGRASRPPDGSARSHALRIDRA